MFAAAEHQHHYRQTKSSRAKKEIELGETGGAFQKKAHYGAPSINPGKPHRETGYIREFFRSSSLDGRP
jgi:hypothetical protein